MHKDYYCAYHHTQIITGFCRCRDCLLPTCQTCIRLHNQQHAINKTQPQYENMTSIFKQINTQLQQLQIKTKKLTNSLIFIQKSRKNEMNSIRQLINNKTKQIIGIFQQILKDIDRRIINKIYEMDSQFIQEIQRLDDQVMIIQKSIQKQRCGIQSQQSLKTVISFFETNKKEHIQQYIQQVQKKIRQFSRKTIQINFMTGIENKISQIMTDIVEIKQIKQ